MKDILKEKINPEQLKEAMRAWTTGVAIVTGNFEDQVHGMTANSFNSIALSPPTILVSLMQHTRTQKLIRQSGVFGVSILNSDQIKIAQRFAGQIQTKVPRFEDIQTFTMATGAPLIEGGIAFLDCKVVQAIDVGKSTAFLGEVLAAKKDPAPHEPLVYFNRQWRKLDLR